MADVKCAVCGEAFDYYGARTGDMKWWEFELFQKGAGCPGCEGEKPEEVEPEEVLEAHLRSVVFGGTDDPDSFPLLHAFPSVDGAPWPRPRWEEPKPAVVWQCVACGVAVVRSLERPMNDDPNGRQWLEWHFLNGRVRYIDREPEPEPPYKLGEDAFCDECATACSECGSMVVIGDDRWGPDEGGGIKDPRSTSYMNPDFVCSDCYYRATEEEQRAGVAQCLSDFVWKHDLEDQVDQRGWSTDRGEFLDQVWAWLCENFPEKTEYCEGGNSPRDEQISQCLVELGFDLSAEEAA